MKKLISIILWLSVASAIAQNEVDALRYSQLNLFGTARFTSMAGAFGALGGDFTALSINPAGLGIYKKSEFTFTPGFNNIKTNSFFYNNKERDYDYNFNISNCGFVVAFSDNYSGDIENGWKAVNLAVSYNRINDFNNNIMISGNNSESSLLDYFVATANGITPDYLDGFTNKLAFRTWLIDTIDSITYQSIIPDNSEITQSKSINTSGRIGETVISIAGNHSNRFYIGASVGFPYIKYIQDAEYTEEAVDSIPNFNSFTMIEYLKTTGAGFNFKFGFIYKVFNWFRIGGTVHTPSFFDMHDDWNSNMTANVKGDKYYAESPKGEYDYELTTPLRATGSIAFVFGDKGIVSSDYEVIDYSEARLRSGRYNYLNENSAIEDKYTATYNYRIGAEWRFDPFTFRSGIAYIGSPYKEDVDNNTEYFDYSVGFGIREEGYFIDFAYTIREYTEKYYLYPSNSLEPASINPKSNTFLVTLGYRF